MKNDLWFYGDDIISKQLVISLDDHIGMIIGKKRGFGVPDKPPPEDAGDFYILPEEDFRRISFPQPLKEGWGWEKADLNKVKSKLKSVDSLGARAIIQNYIFG